MPIGKSVDTPCVTKLVSRELCVVCLFVGLCCNESLLPSSSTTTGHGFGLPHTDENPNNSDLGNCLDYTNWPENNQLPGEVNFARLRSIYIAGENGNSNGNTAQADSVVVEDTGDKRDGQGRYLRRVVVRRYLYEDVYNAFN